MNNLNTFAAGDENYIAKLNQDNATIKQAIDALEALVGGATNLQAATVPKGLQYIFDRPGIIGKESYKPSEGVLTSPNYNLTIAQGGFWDGSSLAYQDASSAISMSSKGTGTYYVNVDSAGMPSLVSTGGSRTVWQLSYNASTHEVSDVALYSGLAVLFDGADYNDALDSAQLGLSFQSLAARLEEIESRLVEIGTFYQYDEAATSGLDFGYRAGKVRNDNVVWSSPAGTVTLTDDATNYFEVNPADGTVGANTTGFTTAMIPLYEVVTASGEITSIAEKRTWVAAGGGGGGGGHTQNTDTGTTANAFKLNMDESGTPSQDCRLEVERGTAANVALKWSEAGRKWQFTNDGTNYQDIADLAGNLAAQEFTKYVGLDDPPKVLEGLARNSSTGYETLDLSSFITLAPNGVKAVALRVFFWDSSPGALVNVMLRAANSGGAPAEAYTVWSNQYGPALLILPVIDDPAIEYFVNASGAGTANVKIYLAGYFAKVIGVGTVSKQTVQEGISVAASGNTVTDIAGACNRGLAHYLKVTEIGGLMTGSYNLALYADAACSILLYQAVNLTPSTSYEDYLPFWLRDADNAGKLHVKIINNDTGQAGTFTVELHYEQFA